MDATALRNGIQATLDANSDVRRQAELDLKNAEENPGFSDALLNILETEQDAGVRLSSSVYLKNRVTKRWSPSEDSEKSNTLADSEKTAVKSRILPILRAANPQVRAQLVATLQKILHYDFPQNWPEFLQATTSLLNSQDIPSVFAGLQCLLAICRTYRFKVGDTRTDFDQIVEQTFPHLLQIGNSLVNETSLEAGEMLRTVLKAYKHTIYFDLPKYLRGHEAMSGWCTLFLTVVAKTPPESAMPEDEDEREINHWWKCKKWSYVNLNRLFIRYGNPASLQKNNEDDYGEVAKTFIKDFAPVILRGYLEQIEKWVGKTTWLSKPCLSHTLAFMDECVKPKSMWDNLKPHMKILIEHLLFPVLCQSDEDLELFTEEPQEYLHRKLNFYEEVSSPDIAATNFLVTLTKARRKQVFDVLTFINEVVNRYEAAPDDQKNPVQKEGALRMIGTLSGVILGKKSPIADQVEYFFVRHVFPEFRSKHGFLRARACDTLEKFEQLEFKDPNNLLIIYRNILESMADTDLPVRVEAALALQPLIRHDIIRTSMQQNIPQIMQQLLKLANEVDVDALANVMEDFVEVFAAELAPFAVALSEQLRDTYLRIVREILERSSGRDDDADYGDFLDDKSITALGVLQTIGTLILTLESTPDVLAHLETILMPVVTITLEHKLYDLYNEVFEIIDSCTYSAKTISPTMWGGFELITKTFNQGGELYLEDMLPALENFVAYGSAQMIQHPPYLEAVVEMVRKIFKDEKVGGVDRICGCKLAEVMMLNLRGHIDQQLPEFVSLAMTDLSNDKNKVKSYKIHLMEMVINAIYCNPTLALHVLESNGWTNKFFSLWFSSIDMFTRVHDKKLSICAISALLVIPGDQIPRSVQPGWPRLLQGMVRLFQTLPAAEKNREEATKEDDLGLGGDYDDDEDDEWEAEVDWTNEEEGESADVKDESTAYLDFLSQQATKYSAAGGDDDDEEELEEESLLETPLDKIEPYGLLKASLMQCQQQHPQVYENITKHLTSDERQVIEAAVSQADQIAVQQQAALQSPKSAIFGRDRGHVRSSRSEEGSKKKKNGRKTIETPGHGTKEDEAANTFVASRSLEREAGILRDGTSSKSGQEQQDTHNFIAIGHRDKKRKAVESLPDEIARQDICKTSANPNEDVLTQTLDDIVNSLIEVAGNHGMQHLPSPGENPTLLPRIINMFIDRVRKRLPSRQNGGDTGPAGGSDTSPHERTPHLTVPAKKPLVTAVGMDTNRRPVTGTRPRLPLDRQQVSPPMDLGPSIFTRFSERDHVAELLAQIARQNAQESSAPARARDKARDARSATQVQTPPGASAAPGTPAPAARPVASLARETRDAAHSSGSAAPSMPRASLRTDAVDAATHPCPASSRRGPYPWDEPGEDTAAGMATSGPFPGHELPGFARRERPRLENETPAQARYGDALWERIRRRTRQREEAERERAERERAERERAEKERAEREEVRREGVRGVEARRGQVPRGLDTSSEMDPGLDEDDDVGGNEGKHDLEKEYEDGEEEYTDGEEEYEDGEEEYEEGEVIESEEEGVEEDEDDDDDF